MNISFNIEYWSVYVYLSVISYGIGNIQQLFYLCLKMLLQWCRKRKKNCLAISTHVVLKLLVHLSVAKKSAKSVLLNLTYNGAFWVNFKQPLSIKTRLFCGEWNFPWTPLNSNCSKNRGLVTIQISKKRNFKIFELYC